MRIRADLLRLQDTTAQIRVRGAIVLLVGFAAVAEQLGLEAILGAFIAGAILSLADRDQVDDPPGLPAQARGDRLRRLHPGLLRRPAACASTSTRCSRDASNLAMVPVFLAALLVVRGLPGARSTAAARAAAAGDRRAPAGDVAAVHRRRDGDRHGPRAASTRRGARRSSAPGCCRSCASRSLGLILLRRDGARREPDARPRPPLAM